MAFSLTDETFAVAFNYATQLRQAVPEPKSFSSYYLGSGSLMYINWILCAVWVGIVAGNQLPELTSFGLDIAMVVAFVGIVVPHLRLPSHWLCALVAGVCGTLTYHWPNQTGLLVSAFLAIVVGVLSENLTSKSNKANSMEQTS